MVNMVILVGNLGQDPELRSTGSGTAVCNMSLATSRKWKDRDGNSQEKTEWHRIVVWGKQAESCNEYLSKGSQVYVQGRIETRKWEDKEGNDRYSTEITAENVRFLSRAGSSGGAGSSSGSGGSSGSEDDIPF